MGVRCVINVDTIGGMFECLMKALIYKRYLNINVVVVVVVVVKTRWVKRMYLVSRYRLLSYHCLTCVYSKKVRTSTKLAVNWSLRFRINAHLRFILSNTICYHFTETPSQSLKWRNHYWILITLKRLMMSKMSRQLSIQYATTNENSVWYQWGISFGQAWNVCWSLIFAYVLN